MSPTDLNKTEKIIHFYSQTTNKCPIPTNPNFWPFILSNPWIENFYSRVSFSNDTSYTIMPLYKKSEQ